VVEDKHGGKQWNCPECETPITIPNKVLEEDMVSETSLRIPKMFTDKFLQDQESSLSSQIEASRRDISRLEDDIAGIRSFLEQDENDERDWRRRNSKHSPYDDTPYGWGIANKHRRISEGEQSISQKRTQLRAIESELKEVKALLRITEVGRVENHYLRLLGTYSGTFSEEKWLKLAEQFREMEGYKDTTKLANECSRRTKYERLCKQMNEATTEKEYERLAKVFRYREMSGYRNTAELANECEIREEQKRQERIEQERLKT